LAKIKLELDLKYVNGYFDRSRPHQPKRWFFRVRGQTAIRLLGEPGSEEFKAAHDAAMEALKAGTKAKPTGEELTAPGHREGAAYQLLRNQSRLEGQIRG
jgi:hypothetical protein